MDKTRVVAELNRLLSMEYATYIAYQTMAAILVGEDAPYWEAILLRMSTAGLEHASELRKRIVALGCVPTTHVDDAPFDIDVREFLEKMLPLERDAQVRYLGLYKAASPEHLILRETAEHIAKDVLRDIEEIKRLLADAE